MICKVYENELSAYLDGELTAAQAARLEAHLRVCPHCQGELHELSGISGYIRAASQGLHVSQDFDQRVLRSVTTYQLTGRVPRARRSLLRPLLIAGLTLLAALGALQHLLNRPPAAPLPLRQPAAAAVAPVAPTAIDRDDRR